MDAFLPNFFTTLLNPNPLPEGVSTLTPPGDGVGLNSTPHTTNPQPTDHIPTTPTVPVILIHGTWLNAHNTWNMLARELHHAGHQVYAFNYGKDPNTKIGKVAGVFANSSLRKSQTEVAAFIHHVLQTTGATHVDLVGHSQGVAQARMFAADQHAAGHQVVRRIVGIGPAHHGATLSGINTLLKRLDRNQNNEQKVAKVLGAAAVEQALGSPFCEELNANGDTVPGVDYTMILAKYDGIATPVRHQIMTAGDGAIVRNVYVQDEGNRWDFSGHLSMLYSPRTVDIVKEALTPGDDGPAEYRRTHPWTRGVVLPMLGAVRVPRVRGVRAR